MAADSAPLPDRPDRLIARRRWAPPRLLHADIKELTAAQSNSGTDIFGMMRLVPWLPFKAPA